MPAHPAAITNTHILRELRQLPPNKVQEVWDFIRFLRQQRAPVATRQPSLAQPRKLLDFAGTLKDSANFNGNPLHAQDAMRREWD